MRPSYLYNGKSYASKTALIYLDGPRTCEECPDGADDAENDCQSNSCFNNKHSVILAVRNIFWKHRKLFAFYIICQQWYRAGCRLLPFCRQGLVHTAPASISYYQRCSFVLGFELRKCYYMRPAHDININISKFLFDLRSSIRWVSLKCLRMRLLNQCHILAVPD